MTSASHPRSRMQPTTESSVAGMRALSLKAGITMLYFGYCVTDDHHLPVFRFPPDRIMGKRLWT